MSFAERIEKSELTRDLAGREEAAAPSTEFVIEVGGDLLSVTILSKYDAGCAIPLAASDFGKIHGRGPRSRWLRPDDSTVDVRDFLLSGQFAAALKAQGYDITPEIEGLITEAVETCRYHISFDVVAARQDHEEHLSDHAHLIDCGLADGGEAQMLVRRFYAGVRRSSEGGRAGMRTWLKTLVSGAAK